MYNFIHFIYISIFSSERESEKKKKKTRREERDLTISRPYVDGLGAGMPGSYSSTCIIPRSPLRTTFSLSK